MLHVLRDVATLWRVIFSCSGCSFDKQDGVFQFWTAVVYCRLWTFLAAFFYVRKINKLFLTNRVRSRCGNFNRLYFCFKWTALCSINICTFGLHDKSIITISYPDQVMSEIQLFFDAIRCRWTFKIVLGIRPHVCSRFELLKERVLVYKIIIPFTSVPTVQMFTQYPCSVSFQWIK